MNSHYNLHSEDNLNKDYVIMKILHICLANFFIDNYTYQENMLTKFHVLQGHEVTVLASLVTFDERGRSCLLNQESSYITEDGYKVIRVNYKQRGIYKLNKRFRYYNKIYDKIEAEKPDIIFIHGCQFMDIKQIKKYSLKNHQVKIFIDNHADFINSASNWLSRNILHKILWKHCAKLINPYAVKFYGVTINRCKFLEEVYKIPSNRIELLVMGVDDVLVNQISKNNINYKRDLRKKLEVNQDDFIICTGGKIDLAKNIHLLMQAIHEIDNPSIKLLIFGNIVPEIEELFRSLKSHTSIKYLGWQSHENILKLLLISDLAVFPGTHSVLWEEAVGCGIPALFKYWDGMTHVDVGGNCVFLKQNSSEEINEVVLNIYNNKNKYKEMLSVALEKKYLFSYSNISKKAITY